MNKKKVWCYISILYFTPVLYSTTWAFTLRSSHTSLIIESVQCLWVFYSRFWTMIIFRFFSWGKVGQEKPVCDLLFLRTILPAIQDVWGLRVSIVMSNCSTKYNQIIATIQFILLHLRHTWEKGAIRGYTALCILLNVEKVIDMFNNSFSKCEWYFKQSI